MHIFSDYLDFMIPVCLVFICLTDLFKYICLINLQEYMLSKFLLLRFFGQVNIKFNFVRH